jgi:protein transport protein SEC24
MPGMAPPPIGQPQYAVGYGATAVPNAASMAGMPAGFDSGTNLAAMGGVTPGGAPGMQGGNDLGPSGAPLPTLDEVDLSIVCNPNFLRASIGKIVATQNAANASRLPLGIVCKPLAGDKGTNNDEVEVVDFGATGIIRCKRCRTYINPYVTWADNGRRWR